MTKYQVQYDPDFVENKKPKPMNINIYTSIVLASFYYPNKLP